MLAIERLAASSCLAFTLVVFTGCRGGDSQATAEKASTPPSSAEEAAAAQELGAQLSKLVNEASSRYRALEYGYDEDLLTILDRVEEHLAGKTTGPLPRAMSRLDEDEELAHFRETVRRWEAKSGKKLRAELDPLMAEVAARKPGGPAFHPEFHKHFAAAFDDLIPIEVAEIRERRNRYLHARAKPILDSYREIAPAHVKVQEEILNKPPYNLPEASPASAPEPAKKPGP